MENKKSAGTRQPVMPQNTNNKEKKGKERATTHKGDTPTRTLKAPIKEEE